MEAIGLGNIEAVQRNGYNTNYKLLRRAKYWPKHYRTPLHTPEVPLLGKIPWIYVQHLGHQANFQSVGRKSRRMLQSLMQKLHQAPKITFA